MFPRTKGSSKGNALGAHKLGCNYKLTKPSKCKRMANALSHSNSLNVKYALLETLPKSVSAMKYK